jgi:hypothetical protein
MNRKDRLIATLNGQPVDRPSISFYGLKGLDEHLHDPDLFNIFNDLSCNENIRNRNIVEIPRQKRTRYRFTLYSAS